jgi:rhodanese-related sulfurtransferase
MPASPRLPPLPLLVALAAFPLLGVGCRANPVPSADAGPGKDAIALDVPTPVDLDGAGPPRDTATAVAPDGAATRPDTTGSVPVDATGPGPDTALPGSDTGLPDLPHRDTREPLASDTRLPDTQPSPRDAQAPEAGFHCPADAGPAVLGHLTPLALKTLLDDGEDPFLINVKGAAIGQIPGTDAVLVGDLPGIEALVGGDLCANLVLYCQSGNTSQTVGAQLIAKGYRRVRDLAGGMTAWKAAGYPTL